MNARDNHREISSAGTRTLCKPAAVCADESWWDLLKPERERWAALQAARDGGFSTDETEGLLFALGQAVEQRDHHMAGHCQRLAFMAVALGVIMGLERTSLLALYRGAYLHDVGKLGIPDSILFKPGKLTASEWVIMRAHTTRGEEICRHLESLRLALPIIRHHHERFDGSGYPDGLRGEQIPLLARVLQIADIHDALTSPRPYKEACAPAEALEVIQEETDRGWRDPEIVGLFSRLHRDVFSKAACHDGEIDHSLEALRSSLASLGEFPAVGSADGGIPDAGLAAGNSQA